MGGGTLVVNPVEKQREKESLDRSAEEARTSHWLRSRRGPAFLDPFVHILDPAEKRVGPYVKKGSVVADLGCGWGHSSFVLADFVGPEGRVYSVDLAEKCIRAIQRRAEKRGYRNVEAHLSTAAQVSFIPDGSVDFVFANGLLCSMAVDRPLAVSEVIRILKPTGRAYLSLGAAPPYGYVDRAEWEAMLAGFKVEHGGRFEEKWALVSLRQEVSSVRGPVPP